MGFGSVRGELGERASRLFSIGGSGAFGERVPWVEYGDNEGGDIELDVRGFWVGVV